MKRCYWVIVAAVMLLVTVGRAQVPPPPPMDVLFDNRLVAESDEWLSINLFWTGIDAKVGVEPAKAKDAGNFLIFSPDDPRFGEKGLPPVAAGSRTRTIKIPQRNTQMVKATAVFLKLSQPMTAGHHYGVRLAGEVGEALKAASAPLPALLFDDRQTINENLRLNQLGYVPGYPKIAYLGQYLGDAGALETGAKEFALLDAAGKTVFTGPIKPRGINDELVGHKVYELDFTAFETEGTYRLHVPGIGVSYTIDIGKRALLPLYVNLMRGNFQERCGQAMEKPYFRHVREACHLDDAYLDAEAEKSKFVEPKHPPLFATKYDGQIHPAIHGHHDAGDFGKYTTTGCAYVFSILNAMEVFPDRFREDAAGLPTSGNGIPDLLEEVKWELDWLENMQDPTDGGVFGVIRPRNGGYEHFMPPKEGKRWFFPKDTTYTAAYAGALAHAARSPLIQKYYADDAKRYLLKAKKAWEFLGTHPTAVEWTFYGSIFGDWDERCWAAVELYAATGEQPYHDYFLKEFDPAKKRWGWWGLCEAAGYATEAYTFLPDRQRDPAMLRRCRDAIKEMCQKHVSDAAVNPYRLSLPVESVRHGAYGWVFPGDMAGYDLLMGYALTKDKAYLDCALANTDYTCGANPSGYFQQTGLGYKRGIECVSETSVNDGIVEPVPGLPLGIGSAGFYWLNQYAKKPGEGEYPPKWPLLNRWYDGFNVQSEFTMGPLARETIVAAFFSGADGASTKARPVVKIVADKNAGAAPLAVAFNLEAQGTHRIRAVFWDFDDETFSVQTAPVHVFKKLGKSQHVAVTIIDETGISASDEIFVDCAGQDGPVRAPAKPGPGSVFLFHLDNDLKDAGPHALELKAQPGPGVERSPWRFSSRAPRWGTEPAGSCIELDGREQFRVALPAELAKNLQQPWVLEMKLYLQDFAGWGFPGNPILLGVESSDSWLGWRQETWERSGLPKFAASSGSGGLPPDRFRNFPKERWCQVRIDFNGQGSASFYVDGEKWGALEGVRIKDPKGDPAAITFGPFRGAIDELHLSIPNR